MHSRCSLTTPYGRVDRTQLEHLQTTFETSRLLAAIDVIDHLRARICDPEGLRNDLLTLHQMAMEVLNEDTTAVAARSAQGTIWEHATDGEFEVSDFAEQLCEIADLVEELAALAPDGDEMNEGGEEE
jgi:hypothetical protein